MNEPRIRRFVSAGGDPESSDDDQTRRNRGQREDGLVGGEASLGEAGDGKAPAARAAAAGRRPAVKRLNLVFCPFTLGR